jgi:hypothetical protein
MNRKEVTYLAVLLTYCMSGHQWKYTEKFTEQILRYILHDVEVTASLASSQLPKFEVSPLLIITQYRVSSHRYPNKPNPICSHEDSFGHSFLFILSPDIRAEGHHVLVDCFTDFQLAEVLWELFDDNRTWL